MTSASMLKAIAPERTMRDRGAWVAPNTYKGVAIDGEGEADQDRNARPHPDVYAGPTAGLTASGSDTNPAG